MTAEVRERDTHIFARDDDDHYVEEKWCSQRLFDVETFEGPILDPACGWGRILDSARDHGYDTRGSDIVDRGPGHVFRELDFLGLFPEDVYEWWRACPSIVCNPPFNQIEDFTRRALSLTADFFRTGKVAFVYPLRRLPAATWLEETPLRRILLMNPRPSMPTGAFIKAAERGDINPKTGKRMKVGGGTQDFCWLIWETGFTGKTEIGWLRREP